MEINYEELKLIEDLDKRKLRYNLIVANNLSESIINLNKIMKEEFYMDIELKPIGIYLNNKIVELYHYFENSNISYHESYVNQHIVNYLNLLIQQAHDILFDYFKFTNTKINLFRRLMGKKIGDEYLKKYNDICDKILNFSVNEDVLTAINISLDDYMKQFYYNGDVNVCIDEINIELDQIGINKKVEHRKETGFGSSINEKLEAYLKDRNQILKNEENIDFQELLNKASEFLSPDEYDEIKSVIDNYSNSEPKFKK